MSLTPRGENVVCSALLLATLVVLLVCASIGLERAGW